MFLYKEDILELLLDSKADPNIHRTDMTSAVYISCKVDHQDCVRLLLKHNADPNVKRNTGNTAVKVSISKNRIQCLELLAEFHAEGAEEALLRFKDHE